MDTGVHAPFACARLVWQMAVLTASGMMWFHWSLSFAAEVPHRKATGSFNIPSKYKSSAPENHGVEHFEAIIMGSKHHVSHRQLRSILSSFWLCGHASEVVLGLFGDGLACDRDTFYQIESPCPSKHQAPMSRNRKIPYLLVRRAQVKADLRPCAEAHQKDEYVFKPIFPRSLVPKFDSHY